MVARFCLGELPVKDSMVPIPLGCATRFRFNYRNGFYLQLCHACSLLPRPPINFSLLGVDDKH